MGSSRKPFTHSLCEKIIALGLKIKIVQDFAEKRNLKGSSNAILLKWKFCGNEPLNEILQKIELKISREEI